MSGTSGQAKRLEAIQIKLTGEMAKKYDVYYRVHAQHFGWLDWAKNGEESGTAGFGYRLEGMQIVLVKKGESLPEISPTSRDDRAYVVQGEENIHPGNLIAYQNHVQNIGWQPYMVDGVTAGTSGQSLRLESMRIKLNRPAYTGSVEYRTHIQNIGWENEWKKDGEMSGTSGRSLRLEAMQVRLTGEMADHYDVYYRVHAQNFGWLNWAKNGEESGTAGFGYRLEAMQMVLVPKGQALGSYNPACDRNEAFVQLTKDLAISMARANGYDQIYEGTLKFCATPSQVKTLFASESWWTEWITEQPDSYYYSNAEIHNLPFPILCLDRETTVMSNSFGRPGVRARRTKFLYFPENKDSWRSYNGKRMVIAYHSDKAKVPTVAFLPGDMPYAFGAMIVWVD